MTRKRFCKLMMAREYSQNAAHRIAEKAGALSYELVYWGVSTFDAKAFARDLGTGLRQMIDQFCETVNAVVAAMPAALERAGVMA